jgi:predicted ATPase/DNA-binding CsgD family transcriptional regulator
LAPSAPSHARSNLPAELTTFIGRRDELALIKRHFASARLVTLTGPGGVGKTRLALRLARESARHYQDGLCFVALSEVRDAMLVTQAVVGAIGLQDRSVAWSVPMLTEYLAEKRVLLVLDNCEHVLDATAVLAGTLLRACPDLRIVATSRQALGVASEVVEEVPPLSLPDPDDASAVDALRSDALSLFVERAAASRPGFSVNTKNLAAVLELCRRLDGLPLALELAAVRLNALGFNALVRGLRDRLDLLGTGDRSQPRQQTLDATIDWSYQLLTEQERLLWSRLSVFAGGFELDAAEQVCADDAVPAASIPGLLAGLVEKSLVKFGEQGGRERYRVLEVLRQFGRERLREHGSDRTLRVRHAEWISDLAAKVAANDDRLVESFARMRVERSNLWTALEFCLEEDSEGHRGIAICRDLYIFWLSEGYFSQVLGILSSFLERVPTADRPRAEVLWVSAIIYDTMADHAEGQRLATEALAIGRSIGATDIIAWAQLGLTSAHWVEGRWDEAIAGATELASFSRMMGLPFQELTAMNVLALAQRFRGDVAAAVTTGQRALALSQELGEIWLRGYILHFLAAAMLRNGQLDDAERLAREGLEIRRDLGHVYGLGSLAEVLAHLEVARGHDERAATLLGGADATWQTISWRHTVSNQREYDQVRADLRARLGQARYDRAYGAGHAMDRSEVVDYALGGSLPDRRVKSKAARGPSLALSPREMQVARLMADGVSNAQTAAQLFIGERTVESHVASIFNKLGVDSRAQVARWVASHEDRVELTNRSYRLP